jgi:hypothetical protein
MREWFLRALVADALLLPCAPTWFHGQAIQAARSLGESIEASRLATRDSILIELSIRLAKYRAIVDRSIDEKGEVTRSRAQLGEIIRAGEAALDARRDPELLRNRSAVFDTLEQDLSKSSGGRTLLSLGGDTARTSLAKLPQSFKVVPGVVFTADPEYSFGNGTPVTSFGISTNLIGEGAASVFDALGSKALKDYVSSNIAAGTGIPLNGRHRLSAEIGLGLGGINLKGITLWPVLNVEQVDSADARIPPALLAARPAQGNWSSPGFSVGILFFKEKLKRRLAAGKLVPIPVLGVRLPYYYPNDPVSALVALFTSKRSDFQKAGNVQFIVGFSIPLLKVSELAQ